MKRFIWIDGVLGVVTAWRRARSPGCRSPVFEMARPDGVVRALRILNYLRLAAFNHGLLQSSSYRGQYLVSWP